MSEFNQEEKEKKEKAVRYLKKASTINVDYKRQLIL